MNPKTSDGAPEHRPATKELLRMLRQPHVDAVPAGWYSSRDIRLSLRISQGYVNSAIRRMMEQGQITEVRNFRVAHQTRGPTPVPHYRLTAEAEKALGLTKPKR